MVGEDIVHTVEHGRLAAKNVVAQGFELMTLGIQRSEIGTNQLLVRLQHIIDLARRFVGF